MTKFTELFKTAYEFRKPFVEKEGLECYRLYDRESDKLTEVSIDIYRNFAEIQIYAQISEKKLSSVVETLTEDFNFEGIYVKDRTKEGLKEIKTGLVYGKDHPEEFIFSEHGYKFYIDLKNHLDTGVFLDARNIRTLVRKLSSRKRVLNLFSYTSTATLAAIDGGAKETVSVDISNTYTEIAKKNFELNNYSLETNKLVVQDVMSFMNSEKGRPNKYDLIIVDPPTFSHSKSGDFSIQSEYLKLIGDCFYSLSPFGQIIFSTHFKGFKMSKMKIIGKITEITQYTIPFDFARGDVHQCYKIQPSGKWEKIIKRTKLAAQFPKKRKFR